MPSSFDPRSCTNEELDNWIRNNSGTDYHPCGTCRMGGVLTDVNAVVDNELKVIGVQNLRVVDASIMPNIVSGNLNAPVQMIAMKAADIILGNKQLEILEKDMPKYHSDDSHLEWIESTINGLDCKKVILNIWIKVKHSFMQIAHTSNRIEISFFDILIIYGRVFKRF